MSEKRFDCDEQKNNFNTKNSKSYDVELKFNKNYDLQQFVKRVIKTTTWRKICPVTELYKSLDLLDLRNIYKLEVIGKFSDFYRYCMQNAYLYTPRQTKNSMLYCLFQNLFVLN